MYAPGVLWTAAHHKIPILMVIHNNRAYHQEVMHLQKMAGLHNRRMDTARIGPPSRNPITTTRRLPPPKAGWPEGPTTDRPPTRPRLHRPWPPGKPAEPPLATWRTQ